MPMDHLSPANANSVPVIALRCSGAGSGQWRQVGETLGPAYTLFAPEHYGCERTGPWTGTHAFTLADEAARTIDLIDRSVNKVHLVGHSYGGGVALHVALARPARIASLALYEPSAFHLLKIMGDRDAAAFAEIADIMRVTAQGVIAGDYARCGSCFRRLLERGRRVGGATAHDARCAHPLGPESAARFPRPDRGADTACCL